MMSRNLRFTASRYHVAPSTHRIETLYVLSVEAEIPDDYDSPVLIVIMDAWMDSLHSYFRIE